MNKEIKRILVISAGIIFLVLGLVGFALPFLQGFLFLAIGLVLLSLSSTRLRTWVRAHTVQYPKIHEALDKLEAWILRFIGPIDDDNNPPPKT